MFEKTLIDLIYIWFFRGKSESYDCRNHLRVIQKIDKDRLYICGTNAHSPKDMVIYSNLTHLARHEFFAGVGDGIAKCPFDPEDNSTAVWVKDGNPGGHPALYSGTNAEFTKADAVIFRGDIFDENTGRREYTFKRTIKYDSHMLDKPDFVGSYEVNKHDSLTFYDNGNGHSFLLHVIQIWAPWLRTKGCLPKVENFSTCPRTKDRLP